MVDKIQLFNNKNDAIFSIISVQIMSWSYINEENHSPDPIQIQ